MENIKESPVPPENQDPYLGYGGTGSRKAHGNGQTPGLRERRDAALDLFVDSFEWKTDVSGNKKDLDPSVEEITLDFGDMVMVNFGIRTKTHDWIRGIPYDAKRLFHRERGIARERPRES